MLTVQVDESMVVVVEVSDALGFAGRPTVSSPVHHILYS